MPLLLVAVICVGLLIHYHQQQELQINQLVADFEKTISKDSVEAVEFHRKLKVRAARANADLLLVISLLTFISIISILAVSLLLSRRIKQLVQDFKLDHRRKELLERRSMEQDLSP